MTSYAQKLKHVEESLNPAGSREILCLYLLIKLTWNGFTPIIECQMSLCQELLLVGREYLKTQPDLNSTHSHVIGMAAPPGGGHPQGFGAKPRPGVAASVRDPAPPGPNPWVGPAAECARPRPPRAQSLGGAGGPSDPL